MNLVACYVEFMNLNDIARRGSQSVRWSDPTSDRKALDDMSQALRTIMERTQRSMTRLLKDNDERSV